MPLTLDLLHEEHSSSSNANATRSSWAFMPWAASRRSSWSTTAPARQRRFAGAARSPSVKPSGASRSPSPPPRRSAEKDISEQLAAAAAVSHRVENRFYWAPVLEVLYKSVTNNVQLISFRGGNDLKDDKLRLVLEGMAAGAEPRAAAEQFRIALAEHFGKNYPRRQRHFPQPGRVHHARKSQRQADAQRPLHHRGGHEQARDRRRRQPPTTERRSRRS